ncbi:MAG: 2-phosphosulfolactate phosphatase [Candidatus Bathyarchaeia archaeon]
MPIKVHTEFLAKDAIKAVNRGDLIIVVDVLRCTSTIVTALANGAKAIIPVKTLKEAERVHSKNPGYILAGERGGLKPRRFDMGNSPLEYTREKVFGRVIVLTTTSGTLALTCSKDAKWVLIGSFLNAKSVAEKAAFIAEAEGIDISIIQSGTNGRFSLEDFICAGAIISKLPSELIELSDPAQAALLVFRYGEKDLCANIMKSEHSKRLIELGFNEDIEFSCQIDLFTIAPLYKSGVITKNNF